MLAEGVDVSPLDMVLSNGDSVAEGNVVVLELFDIQFFRI